MLVVDQIKLRFNLTLEDTMRQLISRSLAAISQLIYKRILLAVTILFFVGVGVAMANMSRLSSNLIESQALPNAPLYAQAIKEARTLYSSDVVNPLNTAKAINFKIHLRPLGRCRQYSSPHGIPRDCRRDSSHTINLQYLAKQISV
jgi:hypothetical protein